MKLAILLTGIKTEEFKMTLKYLSLFSGIGGFELGINKANLNWECIGHSEINKEADSIYTKHFPNCPNFGDITQINPKDLPDFDVLVGGFPCQSYSMAGARRGLEDPRGKLFWDIIRIIEEKKPKVIFLENVKGLENHNNGHSLWLIKQTIREKNYKVYSKVLNSKDFGVPHNRTRIYIIAFRDDLNTADYIFPEGDSSQDLDFRNFLEAKPKSNVYLSSKEVLKLQGFGTANGFAGKITNAKIYNCITASYGKTNGNSLKFFRNGKLSALSPIECERLQTFPDNWTKGLKDKSRFRVIGNAVTSDVIKELVLNIDFCLGSIPRQSEA
jgi:DNA (cytosine-5)-methyltransferase 1